MIRIAGPADIAALTALEADCFGPAAWSETLVREEVAHRGVLVWERSGRLLAYAAMSVVGEVADLDRIAVLPNARRRGLARDLLIALTDEARARHAARMLLEVSSENTAAIGFYESSGFATISRRLRYYPGGEDALVMELDIKETP